MNMLTVVVALVAFLPPVVVWYLTLKPYDGLLKMTRLTVFFVVGLGLGSVAAAAQVIAMFPLGMNAYVVTGFLGYVVGFAAAEEMLKVIIFNFPSLANRYESSFEGAVFGAAFGSGFPLVFLAGIVRETGSISFAEGSTLLGLCIASSFLHAGLTVIVARGSQTGDMWGWGGRAILLRMPFNLMLFLWWQGVPLYYILIGVLPYSIFIWRKSLDVLKESVPKNEIKRARRELKALRKRSA